MKSLFKIAGIILISHTLTAGCSYKKISIHKPKDESTVSYFKDVHYNDYGIPVFIDKLDKTPAKPGGQYVAVAYYNGRPDKYYHIGIFKSESKPDFIKPFKVIYTWTGKGFQIGYEQSKEIIEDSVEAASSFPADVNGCASLIAVPGSAVGAVIYFSSALGGFVVGLAKSIPASYEEINKLGIHKYKTVLCSVIMEYDKQDRLSKIKTYSQPPAETLITETTFYYRGNIENPYKVKNYSIPEKKERIIYIKQQDPG